MTAGFMKMFKDVFKNETLTLECGSDDCFAVITYKVSEQLNSTLSCIDTGKGKVYLEKQGNGMKLLCFISRSKLHKRCV